MTPALLRLGRRVEVDGRAVEQHRAAVAMVRAGHDLHERRLARAVLADEGVNLAALAASKSTPSSAVTPAKRLTIPSMRSTGASVVVMGLAPGRRALPFLSVRN